MNAVSKIARAVGVVLLFAAAGPAVAAVFFAAVALVRMPHPGESPLGIVGRLASLLDDSLAWTLVYEIGIWPALATGLLYALWDVAAPGRAPRVAVAAGLGGFVSWGLIWQMMAWLARVAPNLPSGADGGFLQKAQANLLPALAAGGAVAGFACAAAARHTGLSLRPRATSRPSSNAA